MAVEREQWNRLYRRAADRLDRPPAEVESVPLPADWGVLPDEEWRAQAFLADALSASRAWLDLGCGTGSVLAAFLTRHPHASGVGLDASDVAVAFGRRRSDEHADLKGRLRLEQGDLRRPSALVTGRHDLVYALFSLQFLRLGEFFDLLEDVRDNLLEPGGRFAATVRSVSRSVPESYRPVAGEANTYVSHEPHEAGMCYHHYALDEIERGAGILGGRIEHIHETLNERPYDPAPRRGWWSFVIRRAGD